jgi:hypothetical protein
MCIGWFLLSCVVLVRTEGGVAGRLGTPLFVGEEAFNSSVTGIILEQMGHAEYDPTVVTPGTCRKCKAVVVPQRLPYGWRCPQCGSQAVNLLPLLGEPIAR